MMNRNKIAGFFRGCLSVLVVLSAALPLSAQNGQAVTKSMAAAVKGLGNYTVSFRLTAEGSSAAGEYTVSGERYYMSVGDSEIYSDGKVRWEVNHFDEEVVIDRVDPSDRNLLSNPTRAFDFADDTFTSSYKGVTNQGGKQYDVIELTPRSGDTSIRNVEVTVDKSTNLPHSVSYLADGISGYIVIEVLRMGSAPSVPDSLFTPELGLLGDYEIIDFR
ncbi:MAG: outer membrane lipoprotein carrier protein LolA [Rikenellaceae bacterium]|nr:outer membrane lipoprotein carrier protein LolA [Rikenellaceae bacterium]